MLHVEDKTQGRSWYTKDLTKFQIAARISQVTGHKIKLQPYEYFDFIEITDDSLTLRIQSFKFKTKRGDVHVTHAGARMIGFRRDVHTWVQTGQVAHYWRLETPVVYTGHATPSAEELASRRLWEHLCYRPGTSSFPLDSHARQQQGY